MCFCFLFFALHFDVTKVSLASRIITMEIFKVPALRLKALNKHNVRQKHSVLRTAHGRNACGLQSFLSLIILSLWSELLTMYCSVLEQMQVHGEKERKKGGRRVLPQSVF